MHKNYYKLAVEKDRAFGGFEKCPMDDTSISSDVLKNTLSLKTKLNSLRELFQAVLVAFLFRSFCSLLHFLRVLDGFNFGETEPEDDDVFFNAFAPIIGAVVLAV